MAAGTSSQCTPHPRPSTASPAPWRQGNKHITSPSRPLTFCPEQLARWGWEGKVQWREDFWQFWQPGPLACEGGLEVTPLPLAASGLLQPPHLPACSGQKWGWGSCILFWKEATTAKIYANVHSAIIHKRPNRREEPKYL